MGCVWNVLIESCGVTNSPVSQCNSKFDLHPGPMVWQIILKDSPIILVFYSQNFSQLFFLNLI